MKPKSRKKRRQNLDTRVVVLDAESGRPMAWQDGQFVFVPARKSTTTMKDWFGVTVYTIWTADLLIKIDNENRKERGLCPYEFTFAHARIGK